MSHGLYDRCQCGHRHPEHSLEGVCRGCLDCLDGPDGADSGADREAADDDAEVEDDVADDHPYRQCDCRGFVLVEQIA